MIYKFRETLISRTAILPSCSTLGWGLVQDRGNFNPSTTRQASASSCHHLSVSMLKYVFENLRGHLNIEKLFLKKVLSSCPHFKHKWNSSLSSQCEPHIGDDQLASLSISQHAPWTSCCAISLCSSCTLYPVHSVLGGLPPSTETEQSLGIWLSREASCCPLSGSIRLCLFSAKTGVPHT